MMPVIWKIPGLGWEIPGYGLLLMIALLGSILWAARRAARSGANPDVILNCGFIAVIAGVVGARAMHVIHHWSNFAPHGNLIESIWRIIDVRQGGLEVYGGLILTTVCALAYLYFWGHSIRWYMDIVAPSVALGMGVGRLGCFLNGCCYGGVCDLPWAVKFPYGSGPAVDHFQKHHADLGLPEQLIFSFGSSRRPLSQEELRIPEPQIEAARTALRTQIAQVLAAGKALSNPPTGAEMAQIRTAETNVMAAARGDSKLLKSYAVATQLERYPELTYADLHRRAAQYGSLRVHPAQIYSFITLTLLALFLNALYWRRTRDGQVILTLFLIEPIARWTLELVRADNPYDTVGFTVSQFIAMVICGLSLLGLILLRFLPPRSPRAKLWVPEDDETATSTASKARKTATAAAAK